jgi:hypothetical protein
MWCQFSSEEELHQSIDTILDEITVDTFVPVFAEWEAEIDQ